MNRETPGILFALMFAAITSDSFFARFTFAAGPPPSIAINEIVSSNANGLQDEDGDHPDWIELHNYGEQPIALLGWGLTDNTGSPFKWTFPDVSLPPGDFLVVFASNKNRTVSTLHTNFAISAGGEAITLTSPEGLTVNLAPATAIASDVSLGRQPDGVGPWLFFAEPTPGTSNTTAGNPPAGAVSFSVEGGLHAEAFALELSTEGGANIHYTLDGSTPTSQSPVYTAPLSIESRDGEANVFSEIPSSPPEGWNTPAGEVFKATVVRAAAILPGFPTGPVATHTYLVDADIADRYGLPVVSVVADPDDLWGYENGIYVPGKIYDDAFDPDRTWTARPANYRESGDASERAAHLEVFETDGSTPIRQGIGLRIHGNLTRAFRLKSLRLYARSEYGASTLDHPFFGDGAPASFKRLILRNAGQDISGTFFRDALMHGIVSETGLSTQAYRPAVVFLDGEYWGIHNIRERIDKHYLASHFGVDPEALDHLANNIEVEEGDAADFLALRSFILEEDMSDPSNYAWVDSEMDVEDFVTYFAAEILFANTDWPHNNIEFWRPHVDDARWRWLLYDTDRGFGLRGGPTPWEFDALARVVEDLALPDTAPPGPHGLMFARLLDNEAFRDLFLVRYADLLNTAFVPEVVIQRIDAMEAVLEEAMAEHIHRWRTPFSVEVWRQNVEALRDFATHRPTSARAHAVKQFDLAGTALITVENPTPDRGTITIGSIDLSDRPLPWSGLYFRGIPLPLRGEAAQGFRFRGFDGLPASSAGTASLLVDTDTTLVARFDIDSCADTVVDDGEDCDDGNTTSGDGCDADCVLEFCGDGIVNDSYEHCDDGDAVFLAGDGCDATCRHVPCGRPRGGDATTVADALFVLQAAVGSLHCHSSVCDVDDDGETTAGDALLTLKVAVGQSLTLACGQPAG